jgi:hypothetical protein
VCREQGEDFDFAPADQPEGCCRLLGAAECGESGLGDQFGLAETAYLVHEEFAYRRSGEDEWSQHPEWARGVERPAQGSAGTGTVTGGEVEAPGWRWPRPPAGKAPATLPVQTAQAAACGFRGLEQGLGDQGWSETGACGCRKLCTRRFSDQVRRVVAGSPGAYRRTSHEAEGDARALGTRSFVATPNTHQALFPGEPCSRVIGRCDGDAMCYLR